MTVTLPIPSPPGGLLTCGAGQLPKVRVSGGQVFAECCMPPRSIKVAIRGSYTPGFLEWAFETVTAEMRLKPSLGRLPMLVVRQILSRGVVEGITQTGDTITVYFKLPPEAGDDATPPDRMSG